MRTYQLKRQTCEAVKLTEEHFSRPDCFGGILEYVYPSEGKPFARISGTQIDIPVGDYLVKTETGSLGHVASDFFEEQWEPVPQTPAEHIASWPKWKQAFAKQWLENPSTNKVARQPVDNSLNNELDKAFRKMASDVFWDTTKLGLGENNSRNNEW